MVGIEKAGRENGGKANPTKNKKSIINMPDELDRRLSERIEL